MYLRSLAAMAAVTASRATADTYFSGDGTAYTLGATSAGNCNMMLANSDAGANYAALNDVQWNGLRNCGRCAEVSCADARCSDTTTTKTVQILDRCPECAYGDLDLSPSVFTALTGSSPSRYKIKWRFVDCPVTGNAQYCLKGGSNAFWTAVQPTNVVTGVASLTINGKATTMVDSAYYYLLDGQSATQTDLTSVQIAMTSVNGDTIHDTVALSAGSCTEGSSQFARGGSSPPAATSAPVTSAPSTPAPTTPAPTTAAPTAAPTTSAPVQQQTEAPTATPTATTATPVSSSPASSSAAKDESRDLPEPSAAPTPSPSPSPTTSTPSPTTSTPSPAPSTASPTTQTPASNQTEDRSLDSPVASVAVTLAPVTTAPAKAATTSTPAPKAASSTETEADGQDATAAPSTTTSSPSANDAGKVREAVTKSGSESGGTSSTVIALAACGAVATVALIVVAVIARRKKIIEKDRDASVDAMSALRTFGFVATPGGLEPARNVGML